MKILILTVPGCAPCEVIKSYINDNMPDAVDLEIFDMNDYMEMAIFYSIRSAPVGLLIDKDVELDRFVGSNTSKLQEWFELIKK